MQPEVTVIMPCKNTARWIGNAIQSVLDQDYNDWELIIVDDASTDDTVSMVSSYVNMDNRISLYRFAVSQGAAAAKNHAIRLARGHYIASLDADDWWYPSKLAIQIEFMEKESIPISYTGYEKVDIHGEQNGRIFRPPATINYRDMLRTCSIGHSTVIWDEEIIGKRFYPKLVMGYDYALWLQLMREGYVASGIQEPMACYREYPGSLSANKFRKLAGVWSIYRHKEGFNAIKSIALVTRYVLFASKKRML